MKTTRLSNTATDLERLKAHKIKMGAKKITRERMHEEMQGPTHISANLSFNHPDYGMTMAEHLSEKAKRTQQGN